MTQQQSPYFITTAIPYVNAKPHLGFALECVITDALARYQRFKGNDTWFLTGTDENSLKNVQAAAEAGSSTQALVEQNAAHFYALKEVLGLSFDDFIRTSSDKRHMAGALKLWRACLAQGDIYKKLYRGRYCVGCEQFYTDTELDEGLCPEHHTRPEVVEEENYFFRLSRYANQLFKLIVSDQLRIEPQSRKNEVLSFIGAGLHDFSISRSRRRAQGWGIPVPDDPEQVMYVWFDALSNYITALGYAENAPQFQRYWLHNPQRVHVIGKGITRFHAVYWPAMLLSAGLPLPTTLFIHGYLTLNGEKISKSLGNTIDPTELVEQYGAEALRYYLLRKIKATEDGDFTLDGFIQTINTDLADQLGNLLSRFAGMVSRYRQGVVPGPGSQSALDKELIHEAQGLAQRVDEAMRCFAPHAALAAIWQLIRAANKYVVEVAPWQLAKRQHEDDAAKRRLDTTLYNLAETLRLVAYFCRPFLPVTAANIQRQLGLANEPNDGAAWGTTPANTRIQPDGVLFPKYGI